MRKPSMFGRGFPGFAALSRNYLVPATLVAVGLLLPTDNVAQEAEPLRKGDVVRLLTAGAYSQPEVAGIVRRSCLTFLPTNRDLDHFRALGAGAGVMEEIRGCTVRPTVAAAEVDPVSPGTETVVDPASPGTEAVVDPPRQVELTLFLSPRRAIVAPGEEVEVVAEITAGASPVRGVRLELRTESDLTEGEVVAVATTDAEGLANFSVPASGLPGVRRFSISSGGVPVQGEKLVEVETVVASAAAEPGPVETVPSGGDAGRAAGGERRIAEPPVSTRRWSTVKEGLREAERLSLRGQYGGADVIYGALRQEHPDDVDVLMAHAYHLARMGEAEEAEAVLQRAIGLEPRRADVRQAFGRLSLWSGKAEEAVRWFRTATEIQPEDPEAWRGLGEALIEAGRRDEARTAYRRARELEQNDR